MATSAIRSGRCYGCPGQGRCRVLHRPRQQGLQHHQRGHRRDRLRRPPHGAADRRVEHPGRDLLLSDNVGADGAAPRPSAGRTFDHLVDTDQLPCPRMPSIGHRYLGGRCGTVGLVSWSSTIANACTRASATAPRPRRGPAWRGSPCVQPHDALISSLHSQGKAHCGCGSMAPSGVWSDTRNMGSGARRHRLEPFGRLGAGSD